MKLHQYVWTFLHRDCKNPATRLILALVLGLAFLGTSLSVTARPTHAAAYTPAQVDDTAIVNTINQVFGPDGPAAQRVALCESSMNPNATNTQAIGDSHAEGLFQILYPSTWYTTSQAGSSPYDATANIIAAHEIFVRDGHSWREWVCQP